MSSFTRALIVKKRRDGKWETNRQFDYIVGDEDSGDAITVPKGFETDFASVPRAFWIILPPDGKYSQAAVLHDYCYFTQARSREESDKIFLEAMKVLGVSWWKRRTMYRAVRAFGWIPWNNHKKEE